MSAPGVSVGTVRRMDGFGRFGRIVFLRAWARRIWWCSKLMNHYAGAGRTESDECTSP